MGKLLSNAVLVRAGAKRRAGPEAGQQHWAKTYVHLAGANLRRADLRNAHFPFGEFRGAELRAANFDGATLSSANFNGATLCGASMTRASLPEATFVDADIGVWWSNDWAGETYLKAVWFLGADLQEADFTRVKGGSSRFYGRPATAGNWLPRSAPGNVVSTDAVDWIPGAELTGAKFDSAEIKDADFEGANLERASFVGANVSGAKFSRYVPFTDRSGRATDGDVIYFDNGGTNLREADFSDANLRSAKFWEARLQLAKFVDADCRQADFKEADLRGACFGDADLRWADFRSANLEAVDFSGADLLGAQLDEEGSRYARQAGGVNVGVLTDVHPHDFWRLERRASD